MRGSAQIDDVFQHYMLKPYFLGGCCCCRMKSPFSFTIFLFNFVNEPHTLIFMHTLSSLACMSGGVYVYFVIKTVNTQILDADWPDGNRLWWKYFHMLVSSLLICSIRRSCAECVLCNVYVTLIVHLQVTHRPLFLCATSTNKLLINESTTDDLFWHFCWKQQRQ